MRKRNGNDGIPDSVLSAFEANLDTAFQQGRWRGRMVVGCEVRIKADSCIEYAFLLTQKSVLGNWIFMRLRIRMVKLLFLFDCPLLKDRKGKSLRTAWLRIRFGSSHRKLNLRIGDDRCEVRDMAFRTGMRIWDSVARGLGNIPRVCFKLRVRATVLYVRRHETSSSAAVMKSQVYRTCIFQAKSQ